MSTFHMGRRHMIGTVAGALASYGMTPVRPAGAMPICAPGSYLRSCDWPTAPSPAVDLPTLGWLLVRGLNPYDVGGSISQLDYWDDQIEWTTRVQMPWAFNKRFFLVDRAMRIPYVGAKDNRLSIINDEHLIVGMAVDDRPDDTVPSGFLRFADVELGGAKPSPASGAAFKTLGWFALKTCTDEKTTEWWVKDSGTDHWYEKAKIPEDKDGAEWLFRGRPIRVENTRRIGPFFVKNSGKYYRAVMLLGYEGSGGY